MCRRIVIVNDKMQRGYHYVLSAPAGAISTRNSVPI